MDCAFKYIYLFEETQGLKYRKVARLLELGAFKLNAVLCKIQSPSQMIIRKK